MSKPYAIGIDVGGTKIAAGLVNRAGEILHRYTTRAHAEQQPDVVIRAIEEAYHHLIAESKIEVAQIEAVGLGFPGNTNGPAMATAWRAADLILADHNAPADALA